MCRRPACLFCCCWTGDPCGVVLRTGKGDSSNGGVLVDEVVTCLVTDLRGILLLFSGEEGGEDLGKEGVL